MRKIFAAVTFCALAIGIAGASAATLKQQNNDDDAPSARTNEDQNNDEDTPKSDPKSDNANRLSNSQGDDDATETKGRDNVLRMRTRR